MSRFFLYIFIAGLFFSCYKKSGNRINKFEDPNLVKIAEYQDRRLSDSLYRYFLSENPTYRREAVLAFASVQDTSAVDRLADRLINDRDKETRLNAAFAIGQTGGSKAAYFLSEAIQQEKDPDVQAEIIEAYGKVVSVYNLDTRNIFTSDSIKLNEGLIWSYYRYALHADADSGMITRAKHFLSAGQPESIRLTAAHFFARGKVDAEPARNPLLQVAGHDPSPEVRMAATLALRKLDKDALESLEKILRTDADYRVRVNAVRALSEIPFDYTKKSLTEAMNDTVINVAVAAAEAIRGTMTERDRKEILNLAGNVSNRSVQAILYEGLLRVSDSKELVGEVMKMYQTSSDNYQKAALLAALGQSVRASSFVSNELTSSQVFVIRSSAIASLVAMNRKKEFPDSLRPVFLDVYKQGIQTGDVAVVGIVADALSDSTLHYRSYVNDLKFLYEARQRLSLPRDYEAIVPLERAIAYFEGKTAGDVDKTFNHPLNWELIGTIPQYQRAIIKTTKGKITIHLFVEEAPGSVANFIQLVRQHYFDNKYFHRVVPNFVIQAGCNRGDGWGSEDYSIRSEFSKRRYKTGSVGMASAGKDTEGTQWFITHSPTPHLDGRYTIFAEVEKGMEVVQAIEAGDRIVEVVLQDQ